MTHSTDSISRALHAAVRIKGEDYVYKSPVGNGSDQCLYTTPTGAPSCIVGWVVAKTDPDLLRDLKDYEWSGERPTSMAAGDLTADRGSVRYVPEDDVAAEALIAAQQIQDEGMSWGAAMQAFDRIIAGEPRREVVNEIRYLNLDAREARWQAAWNNINTHAEELSE